MPPAVTVPICPSPGVGPGRHGTIAVAAGGEFHAADVRPGWVHGQMHLAPQAIDGSVCALVFGYGMKRGGD